ncbi:MAG: hypothetical protein WC379_03740 [Methanoregula sp.]|jgi:hypothetical protein
MSIQTGSGRAGLIAVVLLMSLILTVSAACPETKLKVYSSGVTIGNPGALTPGTAVVMSVSVNFPDKENTTYPETSQLELTSGLDNPAWTWYIIRNGMKKDPTEERKSRVIINGDVLSWPANTSESLEIELYGIAPPVMETKNLTVMRIQDIAGTTCVNDPVYQYNAWVLNTTVTSERISGLYAELARLKTDAAAKSRTGAGTPGVMEKIDEAQRSLDTANSTPVFEFVSVGLALDKTDAALAEGRRLLDAVPVSGTTLPQQDGAALQKELPGTPQQTPASPGLAPVLTGIVACLGAVILLRTDRK